MSNLDDLDYEFYEEDDDKKSDLVEIEAKSILRSFFEENKEQVFSSRQLEVRYEESFFHWIINRAIRDLEEEGLIKSEFRELSTGGKVKIIRHKNFRYYSKKASSLVSLVEKYSNPNITAALGIQAESMVLEGFARLQFLMQGRNTSEYQQNRWTQTEHDLDFIFFKDNIAYGVEVKNSLSYIDKKELDIKIELSHSIGVKPVFVVRIMPKTWIKEVYEAGGFTLVLKYQLYPWGHRDLAKEVSQGLGFPVDSPKALAEGTMKRFEDWHKRVISR